MNRSLSFVPVVLTVVVCVSLWFPAAYDFDDDDLPMPVAAGLASFSHAIVSVRITVKDGRKLHIACNPELPFVSGALMFVALTDGSTMLATVTESERGVELQAWGDDGETVVVPRERIKRFYRVEGYSEYLDTEV